MNRSDDSIFYSDSEDHGNGPSEPTQTQLRTENGALTLDTTKDPRVDLFYKTIRGLSQTDLNKYLTASWNMNPTETLKLVFFIRDIRGKGKGEKKLFHQSFSWLMTNHPKAVRVASKHIPFYGCYKDWLEIFLGTRYEKSMLKTFAKQLKKDLDLVTGVFVIEMDEVIPKDQKTKQTEQKKRKKGLFSYIWGSSAPDQTSEVPVEPKKDQKEQKEQTKVSLSLAWKWAPTEGGHYDKGQYKNTVTKLCSHLGMNKKEYRKACSLMRAHLGVVEGLMCGKKWEDIDFSKVPSRAMHIYKKAYAKHTPQKFNKFLSDVTAGKAKMNTGTLQPHEIVSQYINSNGKVDKTRQDDIEASWFSFIKGLENKGLSFDQSIGVVDTSGSMWFNDGGLPGKVAYSMGLVLAHFCKGLFHNKWIEFSENAKLHKFPEGSLYEKLGSIRSIVQSTNIQSVFDLLLNTYEMFDVQPDQQIKRVFIFTDGQWNQMTTHSSLTNFQAIDKKYGDRGYNRPQLIFWNVRANTPDFPVEHNVPGTALVSGFSSDLLQLFLKGGDINPLSLVLDAINDPRYDRIVL